VRSFTTDRQLADGRAGQPTRESGRTERRAGIQSFSNHSKGVSGVIDNKPVILSRDGCHCAQYKEANTTAETKTMEAKNNSALFVNEREKHAFSPVIDKLPTYRSS
jgi:hypothetical protein